MVSGRDHLQSIVDEGELGRKDIDLGIGVADIVVGVMDEVDRPLPLRNDQEWNGRQGFDAARDLDRVGRFACHLGHE